MGTVLKGTERSTVTLCRWSRGRTKRTRDGSEAEKRRHGATFEDTKRRDTEQRSKDPITEVTRNGHETEREARSAGTGPLVVF